MDKVAQNSFSNGLALENNDMIQVDSTLRGCLNGTLLTFEGNDYVLQNDLGNSKIGLKSLDTGDISYVKLKDNFVPLGVKEHNGILYIISKNPITNEEEIGSFPSPEYGRSVQEVTYEDNSKVQFQSSISTTKDAILEDNAIKSGNILNIDLTSEGTLISTESPTIDISDLNNTRYVLNNTEQFVDTKVQNKMATVLLTYNSPSQINVDWTDKISKDQVIDRTKVIENQEITSVDQCKNPDSINILESGVKLNQTVITHGIDSTTIGFTGTQNSDNLQLQGSIVSITYNCPDGQANLSSEGVKLTEDGRTINNDRIQQLLNVNYNYRETPKREVNYLYDIRAHVYTQGNKQIKNDYVIPFSSLLKYNYSSSTKKFTKNFIIDLSNPELVDKKLEFVIEGIKEVNGKKQLFTTYKSTELINLSLVNKLITYDSNTFEILSNKYNRFIWGPYKASKIWSNGQSPYDTPTQSITPGTLIWYTGYNVWNIALFDLDSTESTGKILKGTIVGNSVKGNNNELADSYEIRRVCYNTNSLNKDHNYIILKYKQNGDILEIEDMQYYFPKIKQTYGNEDNIIPCTTYKDNTPTLDAFGDQSISGVTINDDSYGTSEDYKVKVFGRQATDSGRLVNFTSTDKEEGRLTVVRESGSSDLQDLTVTDIGSPGVPNWSINTSENQNAKKKYITILDENNQQFKDFEHLDYLFVNNNKSKCVLDHGYLARAVFNNPGNGLALWVTTAVPSLSDYFSKYGTLSGNIIGTNKTEESDKYNYDITIKTIDSENLEYNSNNLIISNPDIYNRSQVFQPIDFKETSLQIETNQFIKQAPKSVNITLSVDSSGNFVLNNTIIFIDLKQYLLDTYGQYANQGCFIILHKNNVLNYLETLEGENSIPDEFLIYNNGSSPVLAYFPSNSKRTKSFLYPNLKRYIYDYTQESITEEKAVKNLPDISDVRGLDNITFNASIPQETIENIVLYKNQKLLGNDGLLQTKLNSFNFPQSFINITKFGNNDNQESSFIKTNPNISIKDSLALDVGSYGYKNALLESNSDFYSGLEAYKIGDRYVLISTDTLDNYSIKALNIEGKNLLYPYEGSGNYYINQVKSNSTSRIFKSNDYQFSFIPDQILEQPFSEDDYMNTIV